MPVNSNTNDIRKADPDQLKDFLIRNNEKPFRARQIREWLWKKAARSFDEMTNLSLATRKLLKQSYVFNPVVLTSSQYSEDKTIKSTFTLSDGHIVEGVLIPAQDRMTACISSQVGCSLSCKFCATGYMGHKRNLDAAEIYDQVVHIDKQAREAYNAGLSNIVYMGMGEPLLNYKNTLQSVEYLTAEYGLNMSPKRITVSTAGIARMIRKLGDDQVKFNLALSLHAANDQKRNQIMPINETNHLPALIESLQYFKAKTGNQITFEYILFNKFNDTLQDAKALYHILNQIPAKVNIIEYNPIEEAGFANASEDNIEHFSRFLHERNVNITVRRSRGKDIDAACGQLAGKN